MVNVVSAVVVSVMVKVVFVELVVVMIVAGVVDVVVDVVVLSFVKCTDKPTTIPPIEKLSRTIKMIHHFFVTNSDLETDGGVGASLGSLYGFA